MNFKFLGLQWALIGIFNQNLSYNHEVHLLWSIHVTYEYLFLSHNRLEKFKMLFLYMSLRKRKSHENYNLFIKWNLKKSFLDLVILYLNNMISNPNLQNLNLLLAKVIQWHWNSRCSFLLQECSCTSMVGMGNMSSVLLMILYEFDLCFMVYAYVFHAFLYTHYHKSYIRFSTLTNSMLWSNILYQNMSFPVCVWYLTLSVKDTSPVVSRH